jgi:hypothetical protein
LGSRGTTAAKATESTTATPAAITTAARIFRHVAGCWQLLRDTWHGANASTSPSATATSATAATGRRTA